MYQVKKRSGELELFELAKVKSAIQRTFESCNRNYQPSIIETLSIKSIALAEKKVNDDILSVEDIQDSVETTLMNLGYEDVAKAYILYRKQHERVRNAKETLINYKKTVESYKDRDDWRVKENSTVTYSLGGLILNNSGAMIANYWLSEIYDDEIANAHRNCDIHLHDLSMLSAYCFTGDTVVKSLDGTNRTFEQLVKDNVKDLWVYSYDTDKNEVVIARAENPRITRYVDEIVEITLRNNKKIKCTKDHPIMLRDGTYIEASKLKVNASVMPLNISEKGKYTQINKFWCYGTDKKQYIHRWVMEQVIGRPLQENEVVHHINENKHDNRPENLAVMEDCIHRAMEVRKTMNKDLWKTNNNKRLVEYNKSDKKKKEISEFAKTRTRDENGRFIKFKYNEDLDTEKKMYNHRVWKVKIVKLDTPIPVYDLTVPKYHNFAIGGNIFVHNCAGWSLKQLIQEGLGGVPGKISSEPASHLSTLCNQMVNFIGILQNEWAGAQAFSSVDTYLAPFVKVDNLSYKEVKQCIQSLVFGLNTPSRWGSQAPFSNFTMDWTVPEDLANLNCIVGGKELDFCYKDCKREMDMINKAFMEVMMEGDANGRGHQYPIPTYSITKDFDWDPEIPNNKLLFEMTAKYGIPYFSNYINSDMSPSDLRAMCCRLRLDLRELRRKSGGYFGSGESTGSIGVVTINLPRIAYTSETEEEFFNKLSKQMDIAARSLHIKRSVVSQLLEQGLYPYTKRYLGSFNNHFSTIGLVGMNECCLNASWIRSDISTNSGYEFSKKVLDYMREKLSDYQEQYGALFNLEATPAESTSFRFAMHDKKDFPDIITAGDKTDGAPYYTNSSHLPVGYTDDIFEALDHQDELQIKYTSGTVFHAFLGEKLPNWQSAMNLTRKIAENYKLAYFTFSPTYSICSDHGYLTGEQWTCPHCGKPTEVYSRVTGYYRAVQNFNDGKAHEFKDRKEYSVLDRKSFNTTVEVKEELGLRETPTITKPLLFTTSTCPNCKIVKKLLDDYGFDYDIVVADNDMETARAFDINQAPTLVVNSDSGIVKIANVSNIKKFLDELETEE